MGTTSLRDAFRSRNMKLYLLVLSVLLSVNCALGCHKAIAKVIFPMAEQGVKHGIRNGRSMENLEGGLGQDQQPDAGILKARSFEDESFNIDRIIESHRIIESSNHSTSQDIQPFGRKGNT